MERRARVTTGFWPVMRVMSPTAASIALAFVRASPRPMLTTILVRRGTCIALPYSNSFGARARPRRGTAGAAAAHLPSPPLASRPRRSGRRRGRCGHRPPVMTDARGARAARADEHDVADVDGQRDVQDAALLDARLAVGATGHGARLGVPLGDVEALDDDGGARQRGTVAASPSRIVPWTSSSPAGGARRAG